MRQVSHGLSKTPAYKAWLRMKDRCKNDRQGTYGKRGIAVCAEWRDSFLAFLRDMGQPPSPAHSLDRIKTRGNYEPGNCRWATRIEQARNTTRNTMLKLGTKSATIAEWSETLGIKPATICRRLSNGWSTEDALTKTVQIWRTGEPWKAAGMSRSSWYRSQGSK